MLVKMTKHQAVPVLHRRQDLLVRRRIGLADVLGGHRPKFGIVAPQGMNGIAGLLAGSAWRG